MENHFSLSLSCRPTHLFLFLFHPAAQKLFPAGPFPASWPSPAQRPSPLPVSPPCRPRPSGSSPSPDRAGLKLESDPAAHAAASPLGRTPRPSLRPYKRNPRPLETPNRSRSRRLRKNLARAAAIVETSRSFAAPPFRFVFSTTSLLWSSAVVRGTSPTFYLPPSRSVSAAVARRRFRSAMRRR